MALADTQDGACMEPADKSLRAAYQEMLNLSLKCGTHHQVTTTTPSSAMVVCRIACRIEDLKYYQLTDSNG
jgi:hypothetical protein